MEGDIEMIAPVAPRKRRGSGDGDSLGWEGSPERKGSEGPKPPAPKAAASSMTTLTVAKAPPPPPGLQECQLPAQNSPDAKLSDFADACQMALSADAITLPPLDILMSLCKWLSEAQEIHTASELFSINKSLHMKLLDSAPSMGKARLLQQILNTSKASAECPVTRERRSVMDITERLKTLGWPDLCEALRPSQEQLRAFVSLVEEAAAVSPSYQPFPAFRMTEKPWIPSCSWSTASLKSSNPMVVWLMGWLRHVIAGQCCQAWDSVGGFQTMLNMLFTTLEVMAAHSVPYGLQFDRMLRLRLSQAQRDGNERLSSRLLQLVRSPTAAEVAWLVPPQATPQGPQAWAPAQHQSKRARNQNKGKPASTAASQNSSMGSSKGRDASRDRAHNAHRGQANHKHKGPPRYRSRPRSPPRRSQSAPKAAENRVKAERSARPAR